MKRLLPLLICLFAHAAWAEAPAVDTITQQEREQLLDRAKSLKTEAGRIKTAAQEKRKEADVACWKKTLVSACLNDARRESIDRNAEARKLEVEANKIERGVRERDRATKRARQAEEAPVQARQREEKLEARRKKEEKAEQKALEWEKKDKRRAEERARQLEHAQQQGK